MWNWLERQMQRQDDLDRGVDAGLVRGNRKKWKIAALFIAVSVLFFRIQSFVLISAKVQKVFNVIGATLFVLGFVVGRWAWQESAFLSQPDPKEPPRMFKF
jgi:protein-S-isoprenylcysteine O-methyltransferase Ste14